MALTESGLVRRRAGRAYLYTLNTENYFVSEVLGRLFEGERNWLQALAAEVGEILGRDVETIVLYGSRARGQASVQSDVDLFLAVRSQTNPAVLEERLGAHRLRLESRYGVPLSFLVMPRSVLREKVRAGDRLVMDTVAQGQVLAGKPLSELVANG